VSASVRRKPDGVFRVAEPFGSHRTLAMNNAGQTVPLTKTNPVDLTTAERRESLRRFCVVFPRETILNVITDAVGDSSIPVVLNAAQMPRYLHKQLNEPERSTPLGSWTATATQTVPG
jgi:hypothetical protein